MRGGKSWNVCRNSPTMPCAGASTHSRFNMESQNVFEVISAYDHTSMVPRARCSMKTNFQLFQRTAIRSPSSEK